MSNIFYKYFSIAIMSARSSAAYLSEVGGRAIFLSVILYVFLQLWRITYRETGASTLGGFTLAQILWYLMITESITLSATRVSFLVDDDVRTGALALQLVRPISYPLYRLAVNSGERFVRFALNISVGSLIVLLLVGPMPFSLTAILLTLSLLPLAFTLDFLGQFLIGTFAFWLEDTSGLFLIYSRTVMILGGMLIPIELLPDAMKPVVNALPFKSMVYGPAKMFVAPNLHDFYHIILQQFCALIIFALTVAIFFNIALKRINANGG
jgi:ABC-2 type transport system permease protein